MKSLFESASAIFGVIPGIAVLMSGVLTPPGYKILFGLFIEIIGVGFLLLMVVNRDSWIKTLKATNSIVLRAGIAAVVLLLLYFYLFEVCVIKTEDRGTTYFPLVATGKLATKIQTDGGRIGLIKTEGEGGAYDLISGDRMMLNLTTIFLIIVLGGAVSALVICFSALALRLKLNLAQIGGP